MNKTITLKSNDHLFSILDGWIEKYNTSPKPLANSQELPSLSIRLNNNTQDILTRNDIIETLKDWAIANKKVVIVTGVSVIVLTASAIGVIWQKYSLHHIDVESDSIVFSSANIDNPSDITAGVYFANEYIKEISGPEDSILSTKGPKIMGNPDYILPRNFFLESSFIKNSFNKILDDYLAPEVRESEPLAETDALDEISSELYSSEAPTVSPEVRPEIVTGLTGTNGVEIIIPSSVRQTGLCRNNTPYSRFYGRWNRGTGQRAISEEWGAAGKPNANGIATLNGRYLVAVSPKFGSVGDHIDIVLTDGQVIPATIADMKGSDATSEWGHVMTKSGAVDIIEWEAFDTGAGIDLGTWKNVTVDRIVNYGKEIIPVIEEVPAVNTEAEQHIKLYSEIYGLNSAKVYEIISELTDSFKSSAYVQNNIIATYGDSKNIANSSKEMAILLSVRDIYHHPSYYGVTMQDIKGITLYTSSSSYAEQLAYISSVLGVDSTLNYTISEEISGFTSSLFINQNNPANIMINGSYASFPTVAAGFIEQTVEVLEMQLKGQDPKLIISARTNSPSDSFNTNDIELFTSVDNSYDVILEVSENIQTPNQSRRLLKDSIIR